MRIAACSFVAVAVVWALFSAVVGQWSAAYGITAVACCVAAPFALTAFLGLTEQK